MVVEFIGGILDGKEQSISDLVEKIIAPVDGKMADHYALRIEFYTQLRWIYVYYQFLRRVQI